MENKTGIIHSVDKISFKLEVFEGPLDLLLYLISKNKIDIYDIPISILLEQYLEYLNGMPGFDLEITSEFLAMATRLVYIKSKMLLPGEDETEEAEDPREALMRQLLEYKRYKDIFAQMQELYNKNNKRVIKMPDKIELTSEYKNKHEASELYDGIMRVLKQSQKKLPPPPGSFRGIVGKQIASVKSKVLTVLRSILKNKKVSFMNIVSKSQSRSEIIATFLAVLELCKSNRIKVTNKGKDDYNIKMYDDNEED